MSNTEQNVTTGDHASERTSLQRAGQEQARIFRLMAAGKNDAEVVIETEIPVEYIRQLRVIFNEIAPAIALGAGPQTKVAGPAADRIFCVCGETQARHDRGEGRCVHSACPKFSSAKEAEQNAP